MLKKAFIKLLLMLAKNEQRIKYYKKQGIKIGNNCEIFREVTFGSEPYLISIGNNVKITSGVKFITHDGGIYVLRNLNLLENADKFGTIEIGNNVFIGNNVIIMPNINIGDNVVIGAGSIVTKSIPSNSVACGIPCKVIQSLDQYFMKNKEKVDYTKNFNNEQKKLYLNNKYKI